MPLSKYLYRLTGKTISLCHLSLLYYRSEVSWGTKRHYCDWQWGTGYQLLQNTTTAAPYWKRDAGGWDRKSCDCHMSVTWPLAPPLTSLHFVQYYGLPLILCIGVWPWAGRTDKNLVISSCIPWRSAILSEMHNLNGISRAMTFRCMIQSLFCDVLKFDWHCNFLAKEKSLNSQKLSGCFSSY